MTKSEQVCEELGKLYFFKELIKSDLIYITETNEEKELSDIILRVGNNIISIQIKEKNDDSKSNTHKWLDNKVYKKAKNQTKETSKQILETINFKCNNNNDILDDIKSCNIISLILFDIGDEIIEYNKICTSQSKSLNIQIFNIRDFKLLCEKLIAPMEMIRYIEEREDYINHSFLIFEDEHKNIVIKNDNEDNMLQFYVEKYGLEINNNNKEKLIKFNTYLSLFEKHCINNIEHYKFFIKILSPFYVIKIYQFIDRIDLIIKKGNKKEMYWNSYIIDNQLSLLFISLPQEKFHIDFISFISSVFMHKFKLNKVLTIINYSLDENLYELDFAFCEYNQDNKKLYEEAMEQGFSDVWNNSKCTTQ